MRLLLVTVLCLAGLVSSTWPASIVPAAVLHDAYIWQRSWTPSVLDAARRSADIVRAWRILVAEADASGHWTSVDVSWAKIRATGRPIVAVVRIDGRLDEPNMTGAFERIAALPAVAGVEIDYDCPTSKLASYAAFLAELRRRLPAAVALSITALPTWMNSNVLQRLGADLSEAVLQVHAVDDPRRGLFDPDRAELWAREFGRRIGRPFRIALPAYELRVTWRADGSRASVEGERPVLTGGGGAAEHATLMAAPETVLRLLHALEARPPDGWLGVVWFRLPTDADRRAWSLETWRAVVTDRLSPARISAELVPGDSPGVWTVALSNGGPVDGPVPRAVRLDQSCASADGANGFRLKADEGASLTLEAGEAGRLRAHSRRVIGWARCANSDRPLDAFVIE